MGGFKTGGGGRLKTHRKPDLLRFVFGGFLTGEPLLRRGFGVENHQKQTFQNLRSFDLKKPACSGSEGAFYTWVRRFLSGL